MNGKAGFLESITSGKPKPKHPHLKKNHLMHLSVIIFERCFERFDFLTCLQFPVSLRNPKLRLHYPMTQAATHLPQPSHLSWSLDQLLRPRKRSATSTIYKPSRIS